MEEIKQLYIKLDPTKDADIIAFLQGKPRTYVVKEALRAFMAGGSTSQTIQHVPETPVTPKPQVKADDNNPFDVMGFGPKA